MTDIEIRDNYNEMAFLLGQFSAAVHHSLAALENNDTETAKKILEKIKLDSQDGIQRLVYGVAKDITEQTTEHKEQALEERPTE